MTNVVRVLLILSSIIMISEYLKNLPKKRMAAGVIFTNPSGGVLMLKPTYKDHWEIPGGVVEENESPLAACVREVKEEIGVDVSSLELLCVDYTLPTTERSESLRFVFSGGVLLANEIESIKLSDGELLEYKFASPEEAIQLAGHRLGPRLTTCIRALQEQKVVYLEDGQLPSVLL